MKFGTEIGHKRIYTFYVTLNCTYRRDLDGPLVLCPASLIYTESVLGSQKYSKTLTVTYS